MSRRLYVWHQETLVGIYESDDDGVQTFQYKDSWITNPAAFPLSIALKLQAEAFRGKTVQAFFENLIPEANQRRQLELIAELPEGDDVAFLEYFGEDCAGALTISANSKREKISKSAKTSELLVQFEQIEKAIAEGVPVQSVLEPDGTLPPFSLAGAQAKFPCIVRAGQIFIPRDGTPTTHIVKLPIRAGEALLDSVPNELICMRLAAACGLNTPSVSMIGNKIKLFAAERFDREQTAAGEVQRLHTQDFCQALGRPSSEKYERHGGPTFAACYSLLGNESFQTARDQMMLLDWMSFNLAIGNNDSHAKNISFIYNHEGTKLAPLYDILCTASYKQFNAEFAFKIGETRNWQKIRPKNIETLARGLGITPAFLRKRWLTQFERINATLNDSDKFLAKESEDKAVTKTLGRIKEETQKRLPILIKYISQKSADGA